MNELMRMIAIFGTIVGWIVLIGLAYNILLYCATFFYTVVNELRKK